MNVNVRAWLALSLDESTALEVSRRAEAGEEMEVSLLELVNSIIQSQEPIIAAVQTLTASFESETDLNWVRVRLIEELD